jgi:UDP-glucose 4-epimerase
MKKINNRYKNINNILVTGCAGFIGSNLVDFFLEKNFYIIGIDDLSTGKISFLKNAFNHKKFRFIKQDLLNFKKITKYFKNIDLVIHLSANADVRNGPLHPKLDLEKNLIVTSNVLEAMRLNNVRKIAFASTGSIYGEAKKIPTPENVDFPIQTSLYGASKLGCEGLISAYSEAYNIKSWIFRFVSILGERYTHGHVIDFYRSLIKTPKSLKVLGDGNQKKSYLYVQDCIEAIYLALRKSNQKVNIFNLGTNDYCRVKDSIKWICNELNLSPKLKYNGGKRGWVGDNPFIFLDVKKIKSLGWKPKLSIEHSIIRTVQYLRNNI